MFEFQGSGIRPSSVEYEGFVPSKFGVVTCPNLHDVRPQRSLREASWLLMKGPYSTVWWDLISHNVSLNGF